MIEEIRVSIIIIKVLNVNMFILCDLKGQCLNHDHVAHACEQRCRSVFNIGGYNSVFLPFFRDFEILGGYSGFADFSSFNDFEKLGVYSGFNENVLENTY